MDNALIVFLKYPEAGRVKTRLARVIGNEKACAIYKLLAEGVVEKICLENPGTYDVFIFFTPAEKESEIKEWMKFDTQFVPQKGDILGERMSNAFRQIMRGSGCKRAVIIGTDCPGVDAILVENAFEVLKGKDIVIGPCEDGGYYLLGMTSHVAVCFEQRFVSDVFVDIDWSTERVFDQTMKKLQKNNLSYGILKTLADIDTSEDLYRYAHENKGIQDYLAV